jgi:ribulose-phosphate 3-epimerase
MPSPSREIQIAPSILASNFVELASELRSIESADLIHVDVMDGHFVPNLTLGPMVVKALRPCTTLPLDVHLMVTPVDPWLEPFATAGADILTVHPEAGPHLHRTLQAIRALGKRAGVALNPATPPEAIDYVLGEIDLVLVMSVNPGFGGQAFIDAQLDKIRALRRRIDACGREIDLQVDGGINAGTARAAVAAGANVLVAGSAVFAGGPAAYAGNIARLRAG